MDAQRKLFEVIKTKIPEQYRLADIIEEVLSISSDSAYRRIRGEKELSFSELQKLCKEFSLSMDEILNFESTQGALFKYMPVDFSTPDNYLIYINRVLEGLNILKSSQDAEMIFAAQDIPYYHFLDFPELMYFKLYAWNQTVNRTSITYQQFCATLPADEILRIYKEMRKAYLLFPTKEIWTNQTVDVLLRLLDYHVETGAFDSRETVLMLLKQFIDLIELINISAERGYKEETRKVPYTMYLCPVEVENNYFLTRKGNQLNCAIRLYTVNNILTDNKLFCGETKQWLEDLISKSTLISNTSGRERFRFFQTSRNKINNLINKVELSDLLR